MPRAVIAVIEPDADLRTALEEHLAAGSYKTRSFSSFGAFETFMENESLLTDLVIASAELKEIEPEKLLKKFDGKDISLIFTGRSSGTREELQRIVSLIRDGAADFLVRPVDGVTLLSAVHRVMKMRMLEERVGRLENQVLNFSSESSGLIGSSSALKKVLEELDKAAGTDLPILIFGETGVGKELVAREIHRRSRRTGEFVPINAASLGQNLFEAELFGYEPGAFTGAKGRKNGLVEIANHGTLFLDEIAELPKDVQARFLRFLDDGRFRRLGGIREIETDVRVIAATNCKVAPGEKDSEEFRTDLYYRLSAFAIYVPPLRERLEDISELVEYFRDAAIKNAHGKLPAFSESALGIMKKLTWPGNIRELKNFVFRAVFTFAEQEMIEDRAIEKLTSQKNDEKTKFDFSKTSGYLESKKNVLDDFDRKFLSEILKRHNGNISSAAREMELDRKTIANRIKELNFKYD